MNRMRLLASTAVALAGCAATSFELGQVLDARGRHVAEIPGRPDDAPVFPLRARVRAAGGLAKEGSFLAAENCVTCHEDHFKEWSQSLHARAWTDGFYRALLARVEAEGGPAYRRACTGCHTPVGVLEGVVPGTLEEKRLGPAAREGVTCHVCHSIDSLRGPAHGQSLLFDPGNEGSRTMRGPLEIATDDFHATEGSPVHERSELCAACHDVFHPVYRFRLETPYEEWRRSAYAAAGVQCQDCHMSSDGGAAARRLERAPAHPGPIAEGGPDRPTRHYHGFPGANAPVVARFAPGGTASRKQDSSFREHQALVDGLLRTAAEVSFDGRPAVEPGSAVELAVSVVNAGAGHKLPTGVDTIREVWLALEARDAAGRVLFESGTLDRARRVDPQAVRFGRTFVDAEGYPTIEPWRARSVKEDTSIPARGRATARYRLSVPADAALPVRVTATLRMRVVPQDLFDRYMGPSTFELPVTDMAAATVELGRGGVDALIEAKGSRR